MARDTDEIDHRPGRPDLQQPIIVAIGASAGGVRALQAFFDELPAQTGAAYVVVVHLDPQHRSELPKILGARTRMSVIQVEAPERLKANHAAADRQITRIGDKNAPRKG